MLVINAKTPTFNLPIKKVLPKLFQSFVYKAIDEKQEHDGYKHPNGKLFKSMNFKIIYKGNDLLIYYTALNKEHEEKVAKKIIYDGLKLGEIHIASVEISFKRREILENFIRVGGFVVATIKDGKTSKKISLEPRTEKFQEIVKNHTIQKYEALFKKPYKEEFYFKTVNQKFYPRIFFAEKLAIRNWYGIYDIKASQDMINLILNTGLGAYSMQGCGFLDIIKTINKGKLDG